MRHKLVQHGRGGLARASAGRRGNDSDGSLCVKRRPAPDRVSPQCAAKRKGTVMAVMDAEAPKAVRGLPGATVLHILPALVETAAARAAVDVAVALLRSGARVIVAAEDGPLNSELQGLGGEWVRLVTETSNPLNVSRNARTIATLVSTERVDVVHALGIGASRSAATLKKRAGVFVVHSYATGDLRRESRDKSYSRALLAGDRVIVPSHYAADQVMTRHQIPREKLVVIPRRVDGSRFDPPAISPERAMVLRR